MAKKKSTAARTKKSQRSPETARRPRQDRPPDRPEIDPTVLPVFCGHNATPPEAEASSLARLTESLLGACDHAGNVLRLHGSICPTIASDAQCLRPVRSFARQIVSAGHRPAVPVEVSQDQRTVVAGLAMVDTVRRWAVTDVGNGQSVTALNPHDMRILEAHQKKQPETVTLAVLETDLSEFKVFLSERTLSRRVGHLMKLGLLHRPNGERTGTTITQAAERLLASRIGD
jgi:hypothetical protein